MQCPEGQTCINNQCIDIRTVAISWPLISAYIENRCTEERFRKLLEMQTSEDMELRTLSNKMIIELYE